MTGIVGISLIIIRLIWIQVFRFNVIHRIESARTDWDVGSIWVGGPIGAQSVLLNLLYTTGLVLLLISIISFVVDLLRAGSMRELRRKQ